jgi:hypothetical protein
VASVVQYRFAGLSSDTKPTAAPDGSPLTTGSTFDEADTGARYFWDGSNWRAAAAADPTARLAERLDRLTDAVEALHETVLAALAAAGE